MDLTWLWITLGVIGGIIVLIFISSIICFHLSIYRYSSWNTEKNEVEFSSLGKYQEEAETFFKWFHEKGEPIYIESTDHLRLGGLYFACPNAKRTVIMAHGYRGKPDYDFCLSHHWLYENDCNVLCIYQRAHGLSQGKYITMGTHEKNDLHQWVNYIEKQNNLPIYLLGVSMGCATTLMSFDKPYSDRVKGVIADCGYYSIYRQFMSEVGKKATPVLAAPLLLFSDIWTHMFAHFGIFKPDTRKIMRQFSLPIIFIHGDADDFVKPYHTKKNYEACTSSYKKLIIGHGAGHGRTMLTNEKEYKEEVLELFEKFDK